MEELKTNVSLYNLHGSLHTVKRNEWASALSLAQQHGWNPAGTGWPPVSIDIDNRPDVSEQWKGAYDLPAGQTVHSTDAKALASALADVARHITPEQASSEDGFRQDLEALARFCGSGSFIICEASTGPGEETSAGQQTAEVTVNRA